jgi:hypothetical protein
MAAVAVDKLPVAERDELACGYAALLLHDSGLAVSVSFVNSPG